MRRKHSFKNRDLSVLFLSSWIVYPLSSLLFDSFHFFFHIVLALENNSVCCRVLGSRIIPCWYLGHRAERKTKSRGERLKGVLYVRMDILSCKYHSEFSVSG